LPRGPNCEPRNGGKLVRLANIGKACNVTLFDILESTAEYIYRANGELIPDRAGISAGEIALRAVFLYCGVTPTQLLMMETHPRHCETISENLFGEKP
jgi:hypothetical protein